MSRALRADGLHVTLDHLGEDVHDREQARASTDACVLLLQRLAEAGLADRAEVSVKLSALGQALDESLALDHARDVCAAAAAAGTTVTLDMEDHTTTDSTLSILRELRREWPWVGGGHPVLPAPLGGRLPGPRAARAAGSVCARARTTSPRRSRSPTAARSTAPTCVACGS